MLDKTSPAHTDTGLSGPCIGEHPNFYAGTALLVDEIEDGLKIMNRKVPDLRSYHNCETSASLKSAAEEIAKVANAMNIMAEIMARTTAEHINRKPRS